MSTLASPVQTIPLSFSGQESVSLRQRTLASWHPEAPSSYLYQPSRKLPNREPVSGLIIGLLILAIGILIGIIIWVIYLTVQPSDQILTRRVKFDLAPKFPLDDPRILRFYPLLRPQSEEDNCS